MTGDRSSRLRAIGRAIGTLAGAALVVALAWVLFVEYPTDLTQLFGAVLVVAVVPVGLRLGASVAGSLLPGYNVAEVAVAGPITRDRGGGGLPRSPTTPSADDVVEQIERADADRNVDALLVKLNTPGGEVVPSDDIRQAAADFDGPTVGYTNDMCASGGMWIASGCDELWAREGSIVGSIGVNFAQLRVHELFDRQGIDYEGITSGEYKDALSAFKPLADDEREYLQALSDAWYDNFVERVADGFEMDEGAVRETEARVYLGEEAVEFGMVDALGDREAVERTLEDRLGTAVTVEEFEPTMSLGERLRGGASAVAYAFGAGVSSVVTDGGGLRMR
jgi:protease-4